MKRAPGAMDRRAILFLAHWIFFTLGIAESSLPPSFPTLAGQMGVPLGSLGVLFTARAIGFLGMFVLTSWLTAKLGRSLLLALALGLIVLSLPLQPLMPALPVGALLLVLYGIGGGAINVLATVLVGDLSPAQRTLALNRLFVFLSIGGIIGPAVVGFTLTCWGTVAPPFWATALMLLAALLALARAPLPPSQPPLPFSLGSGSLLRDGRFWTLCGFLALLMGTYFAFVGWIFSYVRVALGGEVALASAAASFFGLAELAGRLGRLGPLRRLSDGQLVVGSCLSGLLAMLLLLVRSPLVAVVASVWLGLSYSTLYPTAVGLAQELRPQEAVAAVSIQGMVSALAVIILPWLHGQFMAGDAAMWPPFLVASAALLVGLATVTARGTAFRLAPVERSN